MKRFKILFTFLAIFISLFAFTTSAFAAESQIEEQIKSEIEEYVSSGELDDWHLKLYEDEGYQTYYWKRCHLMENAINYDLFNDVEIEDYSFAEANIQTVDSYYRHAVAQKYFQTSTMLMTQDFELLNDLENVEVTTTGIINPDDEIEDAESEYEVKYITAIYALATMNGVVDLKSEMENSELTDNEIKDMKKLIKDAEETAKLMKIAKANLKKFKSSFELGLSYNENNDQD